MTVDDCWAIVESAEKYQPALRDDGELQLRPDGDDGLQHGPARACSAKCSTRRAATCTTCATIKFADKDEGLWRRAWSTKLNGNLYPTHGLGPIANCLDINRGDRFDYLVSMSGPSRGLQAWAAEHFPADAPKRRERYVLGDVNTSLIKTAHGQDDHGAALHQPAAPLQPHPHGARHARASSRATRPRSTSRAAARRTSGWTKPAARAEFDHPLWTEIEARAAGRGTRRHGLHRGLPPDQVPARRRRRRT